MSFKERWASWAKRSTEESRRDWLIMEKVREISPDIDLRVITDILLIAGVFFVGMVVGLKDIAMATVILLFVVYFVRIALLRRKAAKMLESEGILMPKKGYKA